jgi:hypothetical protein
MESRDESHPPFPGPDSPDGVTKICYVPEEAVCMSKNDIITGKNIIIIY